MPFLPLSNDQKKKQEEQNAYNVSGSSGNTFTNQNSNSTPKPVSKSGSWTNLNSYLDSNKDNAEVMSEKVTNNIDSKASDAQQGLNRLPGVDKISTVNYETLNSDYYNNPNAKKEDYTSLKSSGGYNGPSNIYGVQGYQDIQNKTQQANTALDQSKTEDGRKTLLKSAYERPNYSLGMQNLDNLLVQNDPNAKSKFENVQSKYSNLMGMLEDKTNSLNRNIDFNKQAALQNKNNIISSEQQAREAVLNPINQRVDQLKQEAPLIQSRVSNDLSDDVLTDETLNQLGLSDGQSLYNLNLNNYFNPNQSEINAGNVSTKEEKAKYKALMDLIDGVDILNTGGNQYSPVNFNKEQFNKDLEANQSSYNSSFQQAQNEAKQQMDNYLRQGEEYFSNPFGASEVRGTDGSIMRNMSDWQRDAQRRYESDLANKQNEVNNQFRINRKISRGQ